MKDVRTLLIHVSALWALGFFMLSCEDGLTLNCFPQTYRCGGSEENLVQYCNSSGRSWQTFQDCSLAGETCVNGRCVEADLDGDTETPDGDEGQVCVNDAQCNEDQFCQDAQCVDALGQRKTLATPGGQLVYDNRSGRASVLLGEETAAQGLRAGVMLRCGEETEWHWLTMDDEFLAVRQVEQVQEHDALGDTTRLVVRTPAGEGALQLSWTLSAYADQDFFRAELRVENQGDNPCRLLALRPLELTDVDDARAFVRLPGTENLPWLWQPGSYLTQDTPRMLPADLTDDADAPPSWTGEPWDAPFVSNQSQMLFDPSQRIAQLTGFLRQQKGYNLIHLGPLNEDEEPASHSLFYAETRLGMEGRLVQPGEILDGDPVVFIAQGENPRWVLERYAQALADFQGMTNVEDQQSRQTLQASLTLDSSLDEDALAATVDFVQEHLQAWGVTQLDLATNAGSILDTDALSNRMSTLKNAGFNVGLTDAPWSFTKDDSLWTEHPDWQGELSENTRMPSEERSVLDITQEEARRFALTRLEGLLALQPDALLLTWVDPAFFLATDDKNLLPSMAWTQAFTELRAESSNLVLGTSGRADLGRNLVDRQVLDGYDTTSLLGSDTRQGWIGLIQDSSLRYAFQGQASRMLPLEFPLATQNTTLDRVQQQSLASWQFLMAMPFRLSGDPTSWDAPQVSLLRKIAFTSPVRAQPIDLFEKAVPEIWHLRVGATAASQEAYDLLGLFHFGENRLVATDEALSASDPRTVDMDLRDINLAARTDYHLYDFWQARYLGVIRDRLQAEVPSYGVRLFALRPTRGWPQFVGWNRHAGMGSYPLRSERWDEHGLTLTLEMDLQAPSVRYPFDQTISIASVASLEYVSLEASEAFGTVQVENEDGLLTLRFTPRDEMTRAQLTLHFTKAGNTK